MNNKIHTLIKESLIATANYEVRVAEALPPPDVTFSEGFEQKIREIKDGELGNVKPRISPKRWVAILIAAALIAALGITAVAHRDGISNLIESIFEGHSNFELPPGDSTPIGIVVAPTYIPEGYTEHSSTYGPNIVQLIWQNNDKMIELTYSGGGDGSVRVNTDVDVRGEFVIDGILVQTFTKHSTVNMLWDDGSYIYTLTCPEELGQAEFEKIIRSIAPVEE